MPYWAGKDDGGGVGGGVGWDWRGFPGRVWREGVDGAAAERKRGIPH